MNGSRLIKRPVRLNGSLCMRIDRGGSCSERRFRSLLFARNGMGATSDQCQCESDKDRSEEHTSELQSQSNLVCRLLLEKKKKLTIFIGRARKHDQST